MELVKSPVFFIPGIVNTDHRPRGRAIPLKGTRKFTVMMYSSPDYRAWADRFKTQFAKQFAIPADVKQFRIYLNFVVPDIVVGSQQRNGKTITVHRRYAADIDNLIKSVIDALQGEAFANDKGAIPLPFAGADTFNPWVSIIANADAHYHKFLGTRFYFEYYPIAVQSEMKLKADF